MDNPLFLFAIPMMIIGYIIIGILISWFFANLLEDAHD